MSAANANGLMNKFGALLNWAVEEEMLSRNPAKGLRLADPILPKDKRLPFSAAQLQRIFNAPIFTGCANDEAGYSAAGSEHPRRSRFWVPLIGLFSGLRLNEICQMDVADIVRVDGVCCFSVTATSNDTGDKHLKTVSSERLVPIHPILIRSGFMGYVHACSVLTGAKLFPELRPRYGIYSHLFSRWFGRFLKSCSADAERTCFHSFRHNFRDALRAGRVERELALALGGWRGSGSVADRYGSGYEVGRLFEAVSAVSYGSLDLSHLYDAS
jgi:integrase